MNKIEDVTNAQNKTATEKSIFIEDYGRTHNLMKVEKNFLSLDAYEKRTNEILDLEKKGDIMGEVIEGSEMPLKVLKNKFNKESRKLVLLVHGAGMNEFCWAPALKLLENEGMNAVTYAWRGHSPSLSFDGDKFAGTDLSDYIDDARFVLEKYKKELNLDDEDIIIAGHSFGTIISSYLSRGRKFRSILNFCAGFPNEEYFLYNGVDTKNKHDITNNLGKLWSFTSSGYIKKTLEEAKNNKYFKSYREMNQMESYLSELFNLKIPENYSGSLEKLLGPTSRKAQARLIDPPFLLKRRDVSSPMHFFAAADDKLVPAQVIKELAYMWDGTYKELPGPHVGTISPYLNKYVEQIIKYS